MSSTPPSTRFSRRAVLGGAAALAATGIGVVAFSRTGGRDSTTPAGGADAPTNTPAPAATPTAPVARATPTPLAAEPRGEARLVSPRSFSFDTFDSVRTGEVSTLEILGRTHNRLFRFSLEGPVPSIAGDLVESWEFPDAQTLILRLRDGVEWREADGLASRPLDTNDVVEHLRRVVQFAAGNELQQVQRPWEWANIDSVESPGEGLVRIALAGPDPLATHTLAGPFALIQRPEAVEILEADGNAPVSGHVSGTGPYVFEGFDGAGRLQFRASPVGQRPGVERLLLSRPGRSVQAFVSAELDEFIARDRRDAASIREQTPNAHEGRMWEEAPVISTFAVGSAPWNDARLRLALSCALNRATLVERLFGGRAAPSGPVPPAHGSFALGPGELSTLPGFRDSETDGREARAAWLAAGGDSLGPVTIEFPATFDPRYSAGSVVTEMLREATGGIFNIAVDSYVNISRKSLEGYYGNGRAALWFGWGPALTTPDPSRHLFETFHSGSATAKSLGYVDGEVDAVLDRLRNEPDAEVRGEYLQDLQRSLLRTVSGGVTYWALQQAEHFTHSYLSGRSVSPFPSADNAAFLTVDVNSAGYPRERMVS